MKTMKAIAIFSTCLALAIQTARADAIDNALKALADATEQINQLNTAISNATVNAKSATTTTPTATTPATTPSTTTPAPTTTPAVTTTDTTAPGDVALKVLAYMQSDTPPTLAQLCEVCTDETAAFLTIALKEMDDDERAEMKKAKFSVVDTKIDGDKADVTLRATTTDEDGEVEEDDETFTLVKSNGKWKASFDK